MYIKAAAFVAPQIGVALLMGPVVVLSGVYAKYYGLSLTTIATVMLIAKLFDAASDPLIGYCSDRHKTKNGSRKPFILAGGLLLVPCSYFLFLPPITVGGLYFAFWYMAFYFALTLFNVPYLAWANEFTKNSQEKTLVFSFVSLASQGGNALFYCIPFFPFFISSEITPEILYAAVLVGGVLLTGGTYVALKFVPDGDLPLINAKNLEDSINKDSIIKKFNSVFISLIKNTSFTLFITANLCVGLGAGLWAGIFFIYVDSYLLLGELFAKLSLWGIFFGVLSIPIWYRLSLRWGKRNSWLAAMSLLAVMFIFLGFLRPEISVFNTLLAVNMLIVFSITSISVIAFPLLCDVVDYAKLKDRVERNALYFSIFALMTKAQMAVGGALGLAIVGWFGFDVQAAEQSESGLIGLTLSVSWFPAFFVLLAMVFISLIPLDERRMTIIRRRLSTRGVSAGRVDGDGSKFQPVSIQKDTRPSVKIGA